LAEGNRELAGLALSRRQVVLGELARIEQIIESGGPHGRLVERVEAADRLVEASLCERPTSGTDRPQLGPALSFDPVVEAQLAAIARIHIGPVRMRKEAG